MTGTDGMLAGIVSRADLVRVFLRPDSEIRGEIIGEVLTDFLGTNPALVRVDVSEGIVPWAARSGRRA